MTSSRFLLRRGLANVALVAGGIVVSLLLAEGLLALFYPQQVLTASAPGIFFVEYEGQIGWVNRPGASGIYSPAPGIPSTRVEINRLGYRGLEVPPAKPAGGKRFLFLGDSNTFGYGIEEGERFSDLLGRSLPPGYDTVNLGVFGFGTDQEALLLESKGLAFAPDIVVLAFSAGDLSDNMSSVNGGAAKPFCRIENGRLAIRNVPVPRSSPLMKSSARASRLKTFFYRHSHIYRLLLTRIRGANLYMRDAVLEMDENEGLQVTSAIINGMDQVCRESGCRLVVLLISHGTWVTELQKSPGAPIGYYPALKVNLDQMGIPVIDTTDAFVRHPEGGLFFADDPVHLTRLGNRVAAEALYDGLSKLDMLPRR